MNICFITNELHPFKPGGIGRLMYNFAVQNRDNETKRCNFFFLIASTDVHDTAELEDFYEKNNLGVVVATPRDFSFLGELESKMFEAVANDYGVNGFIRKSVEYYNGLLYLEAKFGVKLDVIEFPDYGGWGFTTLSAKRAGLSFTDAQIVVRLHSTAGLIQDAEPFYHRKGIGECSFSELERQCIEQADLVVSHLQVITDINQTFYGFDDNWKADVVHEFPPIFLEEEEIFEVSADEKVQDFIFSSRLQPFKRPDLFVKAAVIFLDRRTDYPGKFYVVSYGWDYRYINWLKQLVPERHQESVLFILSASASLRNKLLQQSIVVIPSNYESLCVFAYESALRGTKLILNRECLAFGKAAYWEDGKNCLLFDGTAENLADVYEKALAAPKPVIKTLPDSLCFWHLDQLPVKIKNKKANRQGALAIIVYGLTSLAKANERIFQLSGLLGNPKIELHLIINVKYAQSLIEKKPDNLHIHYCSWDHPNPTYIKQLLGKIKTDYAAFSPAKGHVAPEFYALAHSALNANHEISIVTSQVRAFSQEQLANQNWQEGDRDEYGSPGWSKLTVGGAPSVANLQVDVVSEFSCFRLNDINYNDIHEESGEYFLPLLLNKAIRNGARVLVIPKLLITELPSEQGYLNESATLDSIRN